MYYFSEPGSTRPDYRRDADGNWESRFGDTWEPMGNATDLEEAFEQWQHESDKA